MCRYTQPESSLSNMSDVKITLLDKNGNSLDGIFDKLPVTIDSDDWTEDGDYVTNNNNISLGTASRVAIVDSFMITTGVGFFESSRTVPVMYGRMRVMAGEELHMSPGNLEIDKNIIDE